MEKTFLEKRIHEKAVERFDQEWNEFVGQAYHVFGDDLKIELPEKGLVQVFDFGENYGIFNQEQKNNRFNKMTNYDELKNKKIEKYEKEETDKILNQLGELGYLYDNNN